MFSHSTFQTIVKKIPSCSWPKCGCQNVENARLVGEVFCCENPPSAELGGDFTHKAQGQCHPPCVALCNNPNNDHITAHCCPAATTPTTTTTAAPAPGGSCFPAAARVNLDNGKSVTMAELQIGDHVQTGR